jgi:RHS repeat-associated protein
MEKDNDVNAYTTHYRMLDTRLGRWWSVDPITHEWQSTYCLNDNNPIGLCDPTGSTTDGDYYGWDGQKLGTDGNDDKKVYVADAVSKNEKGLVTGSINAKELSVNSDQLDKLVSTAYGESTQANKGFTWQESAGITDALENRMKRRQEFYKNESIETSWNKAMTTGIDGYNSPDYQIALGLDKNGPEYAKAISVKHSVLVALALDNKSTDFSNGAIYWFGKGYDKKGTGANAHYLQGTEFVDPSHDIYKLGSYNANVTKDYKDKKGNIRVSRHYSYKYSSTKGSGRTIFFKLTDSFIKAQHETDDWYLKNQLGF